MIFNLQLQLLGGLISYIKAAATTADRKEQCHRFRFITVGDRHQELSTQYLRAQGVQSNMRPPLSLCMLTCCQG